MNWDIAWILKEESIVIYFQPIISTYHDRVDGVEALVRGIDQQGELITPIELFAAAREADCLITLDRLCQRKAIEEFSKRLPSQHDMMLFLNVDNSVLHLDTHTNAIYDYCMASGIQPENVVLEINELHSADMEAVRQYVKMYKGYGFMISIDDIGAGYSNLDRVVALKPDIIKIDRELIRHIHRHYYKQQVVDLIIRMAEKTGALVVAEGVEELEEALTVLQYGAQLLQGFYISRPLDMRVSSTQAVKAKIRELITCQKTYLSDLLIEKCAFNLALRETFNQFKTELQLTEAQGIAGELQALLKHFPEVECAYIINENGQQMTDTVFNPELPELHRKSLFSPYREGADATLKAYYYVLKTTNQPQYVSEEYLSLATGHKCITISGYTLLEGQQVILCLDIIREKV